jgi:hypothetical protein
VLLYAGLQPEIMFDETIVAGGLDGIRVLVMPDCDVITRSMLERIQRFQKEGGVIVGDERLCPAVKPDIRLTSYQRTGRADRDKQVLLAAARDLRERLDPHYTPYVQTSDPEVVPYRRRYGAADYVFVVNDHRQFGRYVGHHGIVMENGLPATAAVEVRRDGGTVYDLVDNRPVIAQQKDNRLVFETQLGPCAGRVYLVAPRPIDEIRLVVPGSVRQGASAACAIEVLDTAERPVDAVVPIEVDIRDAEGRRAEGSGYYGAADGRLEIRLDIAPNEPPGTWWIQARELASNRRTAAGLEIMPADPIAVPPTEDTPLPADIANPVQPRG